MIISRLKIQTISELDQVQSPTPNRQNCAADEDGKYLFIQKWGKELAFGSTCCEPMGDTPSQHYYFLGEIHPPTRDRSVSHV